MTNEKSVAVETAKALGALVPELYQDLLQPAAKELGQDLVIVARTVRIALSPLSAAVWGYEQVKDWLHASVTRKLSRVAPENILTPPLAIAGQVFLNLQFVKDEAELRELYANLLAAAMDQSSVSKAHPAYVSIIQQLSPDEARLISSVAQGSRKRVLWTEIREEGSLRSIPLTQAWRSACEVAGVQNIGAADAYLDNLVRLRILNDEVENTTRQEVAIKRLEGRAPSIRHGTLRKISFSAFGTRFIETCVYDKDATANLEVKL